ncbi:hypothetical protein HPP92_004133 [Vanilla planifolia]|uniref:Large ribosomal subunit protein uL6 alpha-beta domain-containing protein n=1 Tax=Vanilla planifolia TaxID=51239 RepID=A0A835S9M7_VANPL|nr:hypothetical protein HPP92_004133 [Vanilla planifolia]
MKPRSRPSGDKIERKPWLCAGAGGGCAGKKLDMAAFSPSMRYPCLKSSFFGERSLICITSHHPASRVVFLSRPVQCKESRIGKKPIEVPSNVNVAMDGQDVRVKGPLGELSLTLPCEVRIEQEESGRLKLFRTLDTKRASKMHGLFRTLTDNMVVGVSKGFEKRLLLVGVGFRAVLEENDLVLSLGFSHPVRMAIPEGMQVKVFVQFWRKMI